MNIKRRRRIGGLLLLGCPLLGLLLWAFGYPPITFSGSTTGNSASISFQSTWLAVAWLAGTIVGFFLLTLSPKPPRSKKTT